MKEEKFNILMDFMFLFMFGLAISCEIMNLMNHTKMTNKICEISEKVGIECNTETNKIIFTSVKLK